MPGLQKFLKKNAAQKDAWQNSEYSSGSEYGRVAQGSQQNAHF